MFGLSPFSAAAFSALDGQARASAVVENVATEDLASTQAVMNAYVNYLPQPMSALPLGTSAAGSVIFDGASLVNGCSVVASGTGTGTGGFALGGNYLGFAEGIFGGPPRADGAPIDLTQVTHIRVSVIAGDTTNGGPYYNTNFEVYLTYFNGASYTTLGLATITPAAATTLISVTVDIPLVARVGFAYFGFSLGAKPSPYTTPVWGLKDVTLYYGGAAASDANSAAAVFEGRVNALVQKTASIEVGQSGLGSLIFDFTSFSTNCAVAANGSGVGNSGGFASGGNYIEFKYNNSFPLQAEVITLPLLFVNVGNIRITYITGNNTNGGSDFGGVITVSLLTGAGAVIYNNSLPASSTYTTATLLVPFTFGSPLRLKISAAVNAGPTPTVGIKEIAFWGVGDLLVATDALSARGVLNSRVQDVASIVDTARVAPSVFNAVALAAAQVAESFSPAGSIYNAALPIQGAGALDSLRRAKLRTVFIDDFVYTGADTTALTVDATVTGNTASGTVESGPITATATVSTYSAGFTLYPLLSENNDKILLENSKSLLLE